MWHFFCFWGTECDRDLGRGGGGRQAGGTFPTSWRSFSQCGEWQSGFLVLASGFSLAALLLPAARCAPAVPFQRKWLLSHWSALITRARWSVANQRLPLLMPLFRRQEPAVRWHAHGKPHGISPFSGLVPVPCVTSLVLDGTGIQAVDLAAVPRLSGLSSSPVALSIQ